MDRAKYRCLLVAALVTLATPAHARDTSVEAIWRVQQLQFDYSSPAISYSCSAFKERIRGILHAVGAHETIEVEAGCRGDELVKATHASISMAAPVEATEANVRDATTFRAHQVLAARMHGKELPTATNIERFTASWQRISLRPLRLTRGDCDLLDGLRRQVLPQLSIRGVSGFHCSSGPSRLVPLPRLEALVRTQSARVPPPDPLVSLAAVEQIL
jgi:hypothetical protein